jgi:ATP/maltotriose-dependent transcriptional regulator MalT
VNISEILRWRGELDGARKHCNAAEDLLRGLDARRFASFAALQCGELLRAEDDLDGAKKRLEQAVMWASDVMTPAESAEMRIAMARLELDRGRASDAEALARAALADLRSAKEGSQQVCGISVLALALLQRGMVAEAATEISTTNSLPSEGVSFACRLDAEITAARIQAAEKIGNPAQVLDSVRIRAGGRTFVQLEMHSRLALGQVQGAEGRETLRKLARDARGLGFKQIARLATFSIR